MTMQHKLKQSGVRGEWLVWILGVVVIMIIVGISKQVYRRYEIEQEKRILYSDISALRTKQAQLLEMLAYTQSSTYAEEQARLRLNLAGPGERLAIIEQVDSDNTNTIKKEVAKKLEFSNSSLNYPQRWWEYFFVHPATRL